MLKLTILLVSFAALAAAGENDYTVKEGESTKIISSLSTFMYWRGNQTWNVNSPSSTFIQVDCPRFSLSFDRTRPHLESCETSKVVFDDGVKNTTVCGAQPLFQYTSQSSQLAIHLISATAGGFLDCKAIAIQPPKA